MWDDQDDGHGDDLSKAEQILSACKDDPLLFGRVFWPDTVFYEKQVEIIESVRDNVETYVPAGNKLGKDFVSGFIALHSFLTNREARVITTSIRDDHLRVLWGEIGRFISTSRIPLLADQGGPLVVKHRDIRKVVTATRGNRVQERLNRDGSPKRQLDDISYLMGLVSEKGEGMAGHHAEYTLAIFDEASGIDDIAYTQAATWAKRFLIIGNCNPTVNFFYMGVKGGDLAKPVYKPKEVEV
jgi:hypothetical protein